MDHPSCPYLSVGGHFFDKFFVIQNTDPHAGFCNLLSCTLNGTRNALENNWLPVVNHDKQAAAHFYEPDYGENVWEYYFKPVMGIGHDRLLRLIENGEIQPELVHLHKTRWRMDQFIKDHIKDPDFITTFWIYHTPRNPVEWMAEKRRLGRAYVSDYIRVKPHILAKVEKFFNDNILPQYTIGVHIRGTDFSHAEPTRPETYIRAINQHVSDRKKDDYKLFLATDQKQFVDVFQQTYGERLITYSSIRSSSEVPAFLFQDISPYKKGEDVLIDILLLSKCNYLFKCAASVGEYALWFNPSLECTDFALESRWSRVNVNPAYLKLNIGQMHSGKLRLLILYRKAKIAMMDTVISIGRYLLPVGLRDWLWKTVGRHLYFPKGNAN